MNDHDPPHHTPAREYAGIYQYMVWIGFENAPDRQEVERLIEASGGQLVEETVLSGRKAGRTPPRRPAA